MMRLYKVDVAWHNGVIAVEAGQVYELTDDEAGQIGVDCAGAVTSLEEAAEQALRDKVAKLGLGAAQFRPPADTHQHRRPDGVNTDGKPPRPGGGAFSTVEDTALVQG